MQVQTEAHWPFAKEGISQGETFSLSGGIRTLSSVLSKGLRQDSTERCDLCRMEIDGTHRHMADTEARSILCACRACVMLFDHQGSSGRFRLVPERVLCLEPSPSWRGAFDSLEIPVSIVFFFHNSAQNAMVGLYPGPAGATECLLSSEAWSKIAAADARTADLEPDVEAVLVRSSRTGLEAFLVPVDLCYELVGRLRSLWRGFDGGSEAKSYIAEYFEMLYRRAAANPGGARG